MPVMHYAATNPIANAGNRPGGALQTMSDAARPVGRGSPRLGPGCRGYGGGTGYSAAICAVGVDIEIARSSSVMSSAMPSKSGVDR